TPWRARLVVSAPRTIDSDPMLAPVREAHPALFAWAQALRGEEIDGALLAATSRRASSAAPSGDLEAACALSAWAAAGDRALLTTVARSLGERLDADLATRAA